MAAGPAETLAKRREGLGSPNVEGEDAKQEGKPSLELGMAFKAGSRQDPSEAVIWGTVSRDAPGCCL